MLRLVPERGDQMVTNLVSFLPTSGRNPWTVRFPAQLSRNPLCRDHLKVYSVFKFSGSRKRIGVPIVFIYKSVDLIIEQCKCILRVWASLMGDFHTSFPIYRKSTEYLYSIHIEITIAPSTRVAVNSAGLSSSLSMSIFARGSSIIF